MLISLFSPSILGILSRRQPVGQRNLQKKRFLNQVAVNTMNPTVLSKTSDFKANTELSITKGLIQFDKPENFPQPKGNANSRAIVKENKRMFLRLTKIDFLSNQFFPQYFQINIAHLLPLFYSYSGSYTGTMSCY